MQSDHKDSFVVQCWHQSSRWCMLSPRTFLLYFFFCWFELTADTSQYGWTPLHLAVQTQRTDIVKLLLIKGADRNLKTQVSKVNILTVIKWLEQMYGLTEWFTLNHIPLVITHDIMLSPQSDQFVIVFYHSNLGCSYHSTILKTKCPATGE